MVVFFVCLGVLLVGVAFVVFALVLVALAVWFYVCDLNLVLGGWGLLLFVIVCVVSLCSGVFSWVVCCCGGVGVFATVCLLVWGSCFGVSLLFDVVLRFVYFGCGGLFGFWCIALQLGVCVDAAVVVLVLVWFGLFLIVV